MTVEEKIKKQLQTIYEENKILIRIGMSENFAFDIGEDSIKTTDIAVYIHTKLKLIAIWDIYNRRSRGSNSHCLELTTNQISDLSNISEEIYVMYKTFNANEEYFHEKVIIMSYDTMHENIYYLNELLSFDKEDDELPSELKQREFKRNRHSTSSWNRSQKFRREILELYDFQCAICRCNEEKLLEAAHIKSVADNGSDDPKNGICLCANHHLMLDKDLIKIDYKNNTLSYVSDSVSCMPWYSEFNNKYGGKIKSIEKDK